MGDPSWDEIAARAGIEAPMLAPGDHPMDVVMDAALYWPVGADHPAQEARLDRTVGRVLRSPT